MKKLNITKEGFEKSKYFTSKYGKLEYVSESGKVFKTNKGKVLMFKEGAYHDRTHLNIRDYDKLPDEEKDNYVEPMFGIGMVVNLSDEFYKYADMYGREEPKTGWRIKDVEYSKIRKIWEYYIVNDDSPYHADKGFWAEEDEICDEYDESTKKFGRKFKESVDNKEFRFKVKLLVQAAEALEEHVELAKSQRRGVLKAKFDDSDASVEDRLDEIESLLMDARALLK